jgi:hypothetical protein
MSTTHLTQLRDQIDQTFDEEELRGLCFALKIDYDNLCGESKADKIRELLAYCQRHNRQVK